MNATKKHSKWNELKKKLIQNARGKALIEILLFEKELGKAYDKLKDSERSYSDKFRDKVAKALMKEFPENAF